MPTQRFIGEGPGRESTQVDVEKKADGRYVVTIAGERHEVDARRFERGVWNLLIDAQSFDVELEIAQGTNESEGHYNALVRGQVMALRMRDERQVRMGIGGDGPKQEGPAIVLAPMPGKVVKLLVGVGDVVEAGQPVVVVEAMKMENELRAPSAGTVASVFVAEGQAVEGRAKLIALE
jgi:biotin carboxyl carrier protein